MLYSKTIPGKPLGPDDQLILVAVNLDPHNAQETHMELPMHLFGLPDDAQLQVEDLLRNIRFTWFGKWHQLTLNPHEAPYGIWRVSPTGFEPHLESGG
jgi:starch synthase (maltosyl-transferring)